MNELPSPPLPAFDALWDYGDPAATEARFRELLPRARESGDAGYLCELLAQVARTEGLQRRFNDAHRTLDEVEGRLPGATPRARVRYLLERGRTFHSSGRTEEARERFLRAWDAAREAGEEFLAVDAAHMLGIVEKGEESAAWNARAMEFAERAADPKAKGWLGALYNNNGWTRYDQGRFGEALDLFRKCRDLYAARGRKREERIGRWSIAKTLRALGRAAEALGMQEALLRECEAEGEEDGFVHEERGECLLALGREAEAPPCFARAYGLLSKDEGLRAAEPERLERLRRRGGVR